MQNIVISCLMQLVFSLFLMNYDPKSQNTPYMKRGIALRNVDHLGRLLKSAPRHGRRRSAASAS